MLTIAICATPKRIAHLFEVIDSIHNNISQTAEIHVFMEPIPSNLDFIQYISELKLPSYLVTRFTLHENEEQLGCFMNHANALERLATNATTKYIMLTQDDFVFAPNADIAIDDALKSLEYTTWFGFLNLYTSPKKKNYLRKNWRQELDFGYSIYWTCFVMERNTMIKMIEHPFYINHALTYTPNQQVDSTIGYIMQRFGKPTYYHNPSLAKHIGDSLIWHYDPEQNKYTYVEKPDIVWLPIDENDNTLAKASLFWQIDYVAQYGFAPRLMHLDGVIVNISSNIIYPKGYVKNSIKLLKQYQRNISYWQTYTTKDWKSITFDINDYIPEPLYYGVTNDTVNQGTVVSTPEYKDYVCVAHNANQFKFIYTN